MKKLDLLNTNMQRIEISSFSEEIEDMDKYLNAQLWTAVYDALRTDQQIELWGFISLGLRDTLRNLPASQPQPNAWQIHREKMKVKKMESRKHQSPKQANWRSRKIQQTSLGALGELVTEHLNRELIEPVFSNQELGQAMMAALSNQRGSVIERVMRLSETGQGDGGLKHNKKPDHD